MLAVASEALMNDSASQTFGAIGYLAKIDRRHYRR